MSQVSNCFLMITADVSWDVHCNVGGGGTAQAIARHTSTLQNIMVWNVTCVDSWNPLIVIFCSPTIQRYVDDILLLDVSPFLWRQPGFAFYIIMPSYTWNVLLRTFKLALPFIGQLGRLISLPKSSLDTLWEGDCNHFEYWWFRRTVWNNWARNSAGCYPLNL